MLVNPRHAFGVDDIALANILARGQIVFFVWVTLTEHKWVILAERRGLPGEIMEVLQNYLRLERPLTNSPYLFISLKGRRRGQPMTPAGLRSLFRHHRLRSTVPSANPHRFRHTFGADMVRAGISLPALQHLMGHSQIHTTMLYVELAPQDIWREYARAVAKRTRLPVTLP